MAEQTKAWQVPYAIWGKVKARRTPGGTLTAVEGAKITLVDLTEGTGHSPAPRENITMFYTTNAGEFLIDLANITTAYAAADTLRVICEYQNTSSYTDTSQVY